MLLGILVVIALGVWIASMAVRSAGSAVGEFAGAAAQAKKSFKQLGRMRTIQESLAKLLAQDDWLIVDSETTGLSPTDVVIELAVMDQHGVLLMDSRVALPKGKRIAQGAKDLHGLTRDELRDAPPWREVRDRFLKLTAGKRLLSYNAPFREAMLDQTDRAHGFEPVEHHWLDLQSSYSEFLNEPDDYGRRPRLQALPGKSHRSSEDCAAVLRLAKRIAEYAP